MDEINNIAKNIPEEAWSQLSKTACDTFERIIFPITATTEGIGRLIQIRFEKLQNEQKIIAAKCLEETKEKVSKSKMNKGHTIKPLIVYEALEHTDQQTDETIRSLWSNLLAKEITEGSVHPEIAKILSKITSQDALLLLKVSENDSTSVPIKVLKALASTWTLGLLNEKRTFNHIHLENLGLIQDIEKDWYLTTTGREFIRCVSDPK
jgi:hypothetical protein